MPIHDVRVFRVSCDHGGKLLEAERRKPPSRNRCTVVSTAHFRCVLERLFELSDCGVEGTQVFLQQFCLYRFITLSMVGTAK